MGGDGADPWMMTPWWHPRHWIGHRVRRWTWEYLSIGGFHDGQWEYQTFQQRAHEVLREKCDVGA